MTTMTLEPGADAASQRPDPFARFATVSLPELNARAALQTRVDRKYLLTQRDLAALFRDLETSARVLQIDGRQQFGYRSTYFDTPDFDSYLGAARSRPNRFKVRTRTYLDSGEHYLEIKTKSRSSHTIKTRRQATDADIDGLSVASRCFVAQTLAQQLMSRPAADLADVAAALRPTLTTHYRRSTLLIEPAAFAGDTAPTPSRATVDTGLAFSAPGETLRSHSNLVIIETKTTGRPSSVDRLLWVSGHRPTKISKFGVGAALMHPHLPANKWNRILRNRFGWQPHRCN